jgi:hypothetical protein
MADFDDLFLEFGPDEKDLLAPAAPVIYRRMDDFEQFSGAMFRRTYSFDKTSVRKLTNLLRPSLQHVSDRGSGINGPLTVKEEVCITFLHKAGGQFQHISALCSSAIQTVWRSIQRVTNAIFVSSKTSS